MESKRGDISAKVYSLQTLPRKITAQHIVLQNQKLNFPLWHFATCGTAKIVVCKIPQSI
jgi:hypothetical protein